MTANTVLLVTASYDAAADSVSWCLEQMGIPAFRLDTDLFPTEVKATFDPNRGLAIENSRDFVNSSQIMSVWYRRNVAPALPAHLDEYDREFCARESRAFLEGTLMSISTDRWMSNPTAIWRAEHKLYQLAIARELGFNVPPTVVTNDESATQRFSKDRQIIGKTVSSGYIDSPNGYRAIFTTALAPTDLDDLSGLDVSPVIFQEQVQKASDIRVTVIGEEAFTAEIMSQSHPSSATDWRATENPDLQHRVHDLPTQQKQQCLALVRRLGLRFGAIDLALTVDGRYIFFEINPNGEWLWLQYQLGFPIADRIAQWLTHLKTF